MKSCIKLNIHRIYCLSKNNFYDSTKNLNIVHWQVFKFKNLFMKTCLECGDKIIGREDKKFCSDACRNAYNNKMNKDTNNLMRNINNRLRKNYRILQEINPDGKIRTTKSKLLSKGFSFDWFTNIVQTKTGNTYFFIYDQGYMLLEQDFVIVVKKDM